MIQRARVLDAQFSRHGATLRLAGASCKSIGRPAGLTPSPAAAASSNQRGKQRARITSRHIPNRSAGRAEPPNHQPGISIFTECDNLKRRCVTKVIVKRHHALMLKLRIIICICDSRKSSSICRCKLRALETIKRPLNLKNGSGTGIHMKRFSPLADYKLHQLWHRVWHNTDLTMLLANPHPPKPPKGMASADSAARQDYTISLTVTPKQV